MWLMIQDGEGFVFKDLCNSVILLSWKTGCKNTLLIPWYRILFENLIATQLVKQQPAFFMKSEASLPCS
jgi:hypothetical protein